MRRFYQVVSNSGRREAGLVVKNLFTRRLFPHLLESRELHAAIDLNEST